MMFIIFAFCSGGGESRSDTRRDGVTACIDAYKSWICTHSYRAFRRRQFSRARALVVKNPVVIEGIFSRSTPFHTSGGTSQINIKFFVFFKLTASALCVDVDSNLLPSILLIRLAYIKEALNHRDNLKHSRRKFVTVGYLRCAFDSRERWSERYRHIKPANSQTIFRRGRSNVRNTRTAARVANRKKVGMKIITTNNGKIFGERERFPKRAEAAEIRHRGRLEPF